jgi:Zn-finger nucleic acid-binding protein
MRESDKKQAYEAAIDMLTEAVVAKAQPANPVPYARSVRADLLERHRTNARDLFAEYGDLTADELRGLLYDIDHPAAPSPAPTVRYYTDHDECPTCGGRGGGGWLDCVERDEHGMTPDPVPCPTCAPERHRAYERRTLVQTEDREAEYAGHRSSVEYLREHRPALRHSHQEESTP